ncbi:hypothetical protein GCM10020001_040930 [Nonomuraea salmonea]
MVATEWKLSPTAADRLAMASMNSRATSSACTCWTVSSPRLGSASSDPSARVWNTAGLTLPAGLTGTHPGPVMWPGWMIVAGNPSRWARSSNIASMAALRTP